MGRLQRVDTTMCLFMLDLYSCYTAAMRKIINLTLYGSTIFQQIDGEKSEISFTHCIHPTALMMEELTMTNRTLCGQIMIKDP